MKKYITYTFFLITLAQASYAQDNTKIEEAKKRLLELRTQKAQIEQEMQEIQKADKVIITEIKDGKMVRTVQLKEPSIGPIISEKPQDIEVDMPKLKKPRRDRSKTRTEGVDVKIEEPIAEIEIKEPEAEIKVKTPKIRKPKRERRNKRTEDIDVTIGEPEMETPEITIEEPVVEEPIVEVEEPEAEIKVKTPKIRKPKRERRNKRTEDIDVTIGEPEMETPEITIEEPIAEIKVKTPKIRKPKRERRNKRTEDIDITIEEPEMETPPEITIEEPVVEVEVEEIEEPEAKVKVKKPRLRRSKRERRNKRTEDIDVTIGESTSIEAQIEEIEEMPEIEIEVDSALEENTGEPEVEISIDAEETPELEIEAEIPQIGEVRPTKRKAKRPKRERRNKRTKDIEVSIEELEVETPAITIDEPTVEVEMEELEAKVKTKKPKRQRRNRTRTEDIKISIGEPEMNIEEPSVGIVIGEIEPMEMPDEAPPIIEVSEEEETKKIAIKTPKPAPGKPTLEIDVVEMPNTNTATTNTSSIVLNDEAALAMIDILTATPPASVPPEVTFYDEKLKLIVGEMAALSERSALQTSNIERINSKLRTIESQFIEFEDMKSEPATARYMNFMQMNIDVLQNATGSPDDNSPTGMLMEAEPVEHQLHEIFFDIDSDHLSDQFHSELKSLANIVKSSNKFLVIEAPDVSEDAPFARRAIERNRVNNIRDFLIELGTPSARIRSTYMGDDIKSLPQESVVKIQIFQ